MADQNDFWGDAGKGPKNADGSGLRPTGPEQPTGGFYAKETASSGEPAPPAGSEFWGKAEKARVREQAEREALLQDPDMHRRRRRRLIRRVLLVTGGSVLVLVVVGVALLPQIASWLAPGIIRKEAAKAIAGTLEVGDVSLSWGGPQRVEGVRLIGTDGREVFRGTVEATAGLFGLATGSLDLGTVTLSGGRLAVERGADGSTNIERATMPPGSGTAGGATTKPTPRAGRGGAPAPTREPVTLPANLRARVVVDGLDATFTDHASGTARTASVRDLTLKATLAPGEALTLDLSAEAFEGELPRSRSVDGAAVAVQARVTNWSSADGRVTLDRAAGKGSVSLRDVPLAIVDAMAPALLKDEAGAPVALAGALGPRATVEINGELSGDTSPVGKALVKVTTDGATLAGELGYENGVVRADAPLRVTASGRTIRAIVPQIDGALRDADVRMADLPDAALVVERLSVLLPTGSDPLNLTRAAVAATLSLTEARGSVAIEQGGAPKSFRVAPTTVRVESDGLGTGVRVTARTSATLDGQPAGEVDLDVRAEGLLDAKGALKGGMPGSMSGRVRLAGVATPIAQPFVQGTGIVLAEDVGPTLDAEIVASAPAAPTGGGDAPPATATVRVTGEYLGVIGGVEVTSAALRTTRDGLRIEGTRAGRIAARMMGSEGAWVLDAGEASGAIVHVTSLRVPRTASTGAMEWDQASAECVVEVGGVGLRRAGDAPAQSVRVDRARAGITVRPGGAAALTLGMECADMGAPFRVTATLDATNVYRMTGEGGFELTPVLTLRPTGRVEVLGAPQTLARFAPSEGELDVAGLVRESLGGATDVTLAFAGVQGRARAVDATLTAKSARLSAEVGGVIDAERASLRPATIGATVTPGVVTTLLRTFAPDVGGDPTLVGPARVSVRVDAIDVPLTPEGGPDLQRTPVAKVRVSLGGQTLVDGLAIAGDEQTPARALGRLGVEDLVLTGEIPVAALVAPPLSGQRTLRAGATGVVLSASAKPMIRLDASLTAEISEGKPDGTIAARASLGGMNTWDVERLMGQPGLLTGLLGPFADFTASVTITPPPGGYPAENPFGTALIEGEAGFRSERLVSERPIKFRLGRERVDLLEPAGIRLTADVAALNELIRAGKPPEQAAATIVEAQTITLDVRRLSVPRQVRTTAAPGGVAAVAGRSPPAEVAASLVAPRIILRSPDGQLTRLNATTFNLTSEEVAAPRAGEAPRAQGVVFRLEIGEAAVGEAPAAKGAALAGRVDGLFPPDGVLDLGASLLTLRGELPAAPTAIVDMLLDQKGTMTEVLGPVIALRVDVSNLPLLASASGARAAVIDLEATSARARATMRGTVRDGVYVSERPLVISITEITRGFLRSQIRLLPLVGSLEKTPQDAPALFTGSDMTVPLDGNLARLNATIEINPGECRFETSRGFTSLLKALDPRATGAAGVRIPPLSISVRNGIASYPKWTLPLGDFSVETTGVVNLTDAPVRARRPDGREVDLPPRSLDVVTWIPAGALTDQALGLFNVGAGSAMARLTPGLLEPITMIPFRTRGPLDNPSTGADGDLFREQVRDKLDPRRLLEGLRPR
jgi:hypothetical protein